MEIGARNGMCQGWEAAPLIACFPSQPQFMSLDLLGLGPSLDPSRPIELVDT